MRVWRIPKLGRGVWKIHKICQIVRTRIHVLAYTDRENFEIRGRAFRMGTSRHEPLIFHMWASQISKLRNYGIKGKNRVTCLAS